MVVPTKLRSQMLMLVHESHPREVVMKRILRDRVWWPDMDADIRKCLKVAQPNLTISGLFLSV